TRLVSDLLDTSRVKTGKLRLEIQAVDMAEVIEAAVQSCRPAMDARLQRFAVFVPAGALELQGDPVRLTQVRCSLPDNAWKYTPIGGDVGLSVAVVEQTLLMTVSDSGIGITAEALP